MKQQAKFHLAFWLSQSTKNDFFFVLIDLKIFDNNCKHLDINWYPNPQFQSFPLSPQRKSPQQTTNSQ